MSSQLWQMAEDSFLKFFCEISQEQRFRKYLWKDGGNWGKFNFLRLDDPQISIEELKQIRDGEREDFLKADKTLSIKSNFDMSRFTELEEAGVPIVSMTIPRQEALERRPELSLRVCDKHEDVVAWWSVNSDGRDRTGNSPLFPTVEKMAQDSDCQLYLLSRDGVDVACGAMTSFSEIFNVWGLATRKDYQRQGLMKYLIGELNSLQKTDFTVQVNLESESYQYFKTLPGSEVINIERRYIEK